MSHFGEFILINPSHDRRLLRDNLFNVQIDPNLSIFRTLQELLNKKRVELHTFDYGSYDKATALVFLNVPYPYEFKNWRILLKYSYKSYLFVLEPPIINPFNFIKVFNGLFKKVFLFDKSKVDDTKYFRLNFPQSYFGINTQEIKFEDKKFLTTVSANKSLFIPFGVLAIGCKDLYIERKKAISFFEKSIPNDFDLYGKGWNKYKYRKRYKSYKGSVNNKISTLSQYKFSICFENCISPGYISEKIFDSFKAKCVPVYYGAADIAEYVPKSCFIDFRDFSSYDELLNCLKSIDVKVYNEYLKNIEKFINKPITRSNWFEDGWAEFFAKCIKI